SAEQQIWFVPYPKGRARRITNDLTDYRDLSVTADARTLVTIQSEKKANIWLAPAGDLDHPTQLTATSYDGLNGLSWTPDGKVVYTSQIAGEQNLWIIDLKRGAPKQLTAHAGFNEQPTVSPDGRYIVFLSNRDDQEHLWRIDIDGKHPLELTHGAGDRQPTFTPDGQAVIFRSSSPPNLFRVPIDGGEPALLIDKADRKSTRLNSSHVSISYAVFCVKKKNKLVLQDPNFIAGNVHTAYVEKDMDLSELIVP